MAWLHALVWQQQYERSNAGCHAAVLLFGVGFQSSVDLVCGSLIVGAADKHFLPLHLSTARVVVAGCSCRTLRLQVPLLSHPSYAFAGVICCCCWRWLCSTGPQLCVHWQCVSRHNTKRQDRLPSCDGSFAFSGDDSKQHERVLALCCSWHGGWDSTWNGWA